MLDRRIGGRRQGSASAVSGASLAVALLVGWAGAARAIPPTTYAYDGLGRITQVVMPDGSAITYQYDSAGNRVRQVRAMVVNHAPVANADTITTAYQTATTFDPRANDTDPENDALSITAVTTPSHGTATSTATSVTYTPASGYSGADSFSYTISDGHGNTATATVSVTVQSQSSATIIQVTAASVLRTLANNAGYTGSAPGNYEFDVASGVTVTGGANAGRAIDTGTWPTGSTLTLVVSGNVYGGGGTGGAGSATGSGSGGGTGGDAVYAQAPITITVNTGASLKSGGGGGGGGGYQNNSGQGTVGGDGGGGGFPNGAGGAGSAGTVHDQAIAGGAGTTAGGGSTAGESGPPGGAGGGAGQAGTAGTTATGAGGSAGAAGYAVRKNGNTVTVTNNGTVTGTIG